MEGEGRREREGKTSRERKGGREIERRREGGREGGEGGRNTRGGKGRAARTPGIIVLSISLRLHERHELRHTLGVKNTIL